MICPILPTSRLQNGLQNGGKHLGSEDSNSVLEWKKIQSVAEKSEPGTVILRDGSFSSGENYEKNIIENGVLDPLEFENIIDDNTKIVALTHISNVFGEIEPIDKITKIAHEYAAYTVIDAAQSVPHIKVDVQKIGCDFMAFSGHKMCAPTGCGVLYIRKELIDQVEPSYIGEGTIVDVDVGSYTLD